MTIKSIQNRRDAGWNFENSYVRLPEAFYVRLTPKPVSTPKLVIFNRALAQFLGLNPDALKGGRNLPAIRSDPLAQ